MVAFGGFARKTHRPVNASLAVARALLAGIAILSASVVGVEARAADEETESTTEGDASSSPKRVKVLINAPCEDGVGVCQTPRLIEASEDEVTQDITFPPPSNGEQEGVWLALDMNVSRVIAENMTVEVLDDEGDVALTVDLSERSEGGSLSTSLEPVALSVAKPLTVRFTIRWRPLTEVRELQSVSLSLIFRDVKLVETVRNVAEDAIELGCETGSVEDIEEVLETIVKNVDVFGRVFATMIIAAQDADLIDIDDLPTDDDDSGSDDDDNDSASDDDDDNDNDDDDNDDAGDDDDNDANATGDEDDGPESLRSGGGCDDCMVNGETSGTSRGVSLLLLAGLATAAWVRGYRRSMRRSLRIVLTIDDEPGM